MLTKTKSVEDLKEEQMTRLTTKKIVGFRTEASNNGQSKRRHFFPIQVGCICVQDTPENPCPCGKFPPIIVWLPTDQVLREYKSKKTNYDGRELTVFELKSTATIFVESMVPMNASRFAPNGHGHTINPNAINTSLIWIALAIFDGLATGAMAGYLIGEGGGLSDALAGVNNDPHWEPVDD